MELDSLLKGHRDTIVEIAAEHGAQSIRVFGSRARGQSREESDLDLLVTLESGRTLLDLIAIKQDLEDLLPCSVDVVTEASISPYIRDQILDEAVAL
jgi:uncharacterized protein